MGFVILRVEDSGSGAKVGVWGSEFTFWGLGFRVYGLWFRVQGLEALVYGSGLGSRLQD